MKLKTLNLAMLMALSASTLSLTGCGGEDGVDGIDSSTGIGLTDIQVSFAPVALPVDSITKNDIQFTTEAEVTTATQTTNLQTVGYTKLIATGETNNGETFGAVKIT